MELSLSATMEPVAAADGALIRLTWPMRGVVGFITLKSVEALHFDFMDGALAYRLEVEAYSGHPSILYVDHEGCVVWGYYVETDGKLVLKPCPWAGGRIFCLGQLDMCAWKGNLGMKALRRFHRAQKKATKVS